jgi:hypothetical protein
MTGTTWVAVLWLTLALVMGEKTAFELRQATGRPRAHLERLRGGGGAGPHTQGYMAAPGREGGSDEKGVKKKSQRQKMPKGWIYCNGFNTPIASSKLLSIKAPLDGSFFNE